MSFAFTSAAFAAIWSMSVAAPNNPSNASIIPQLFREHCLSSGGDNAALASGLKQMKIDHPKLLAEMRRSDIVQLFGSERPIGWIFAPVESGKSITLSATASGMCEVDSYGSLATLKGPLETELSQFAASRGGQIAPADPNFLTDKSKSALAYVIDVPGRTMYIMVVQSPDIIGGADHPIQMMATFGPPE